MALFSIKKKEHVFGPTVENLKITFENICGELQSDVYSDGIDAETMCSTLTDMYAYITGTSNGKALTLPAPATDLDDRHRTIWPEGSTVRTRSRRDSHTSRGSSRASNGVNVPNMNPAYASSRASTNTSSRYAPVRALWIDDEPDEGVRNFNMSTLRNSLPHEKDSVPHGSRRYTRGSQQQPLEPLIGRPSVRMADIVGYPGDEVEQINVKANGNRTAARNSQPSKKAGKQPKFIEDEE